MENLKPSNWELVTPYKLVILALVKNYTDISDEKHPLHKRIIWQDGNISRRILDRALLTWLQQPDGLLKNILKTVESSSKSLYSALCTTIQKLCNATDPQGIEDFFQTVSSELFESEEALLQNDGAIGLFCRSMILYYEQMPFCRLHSLHENLCKYCSIILSKKKIPLQKSNACFKKDDSLNSSGDMKLENNENLSGIDEMELESQSELDSRSSNESGEDRELKPSDLKSDSLKCDLDSQQLFTSAQAGFFFAEQAALINEKESLALSPNILQSRINQMVKNNPQLGEAHYLTYLNSLRVKEYCGAIEGLLLYFNQNLNPNVSNTNQPNSSTKTSNNNTCRYAALNLAFLHFQFGNKATAMASAMEAFRLCNIVNDTVCLHHVVSLLYQLDPKNIKLPPLTERTKTAKSLKLMYLSANDIQRHANNEALTGKSPIKISMQLISSQILSHNISPVSYCHLGALFKMYGKRQMSILTLQQTLAFYSCRSTIDYRQQNSEEIVLAICHVIELVSDEGECNVSNELLNHVKARFPPGTQHAHVWQLCSLKLRHKNSLLLRKFADCTQIEQDMEVHDKLEALICKAERLFAIEDFETPYKILKDILEVSHRNAHEHNEDSVNEYVVNFETKCRINLLLCCIMTSKSKDNSLALAYALEAYSVAKQNYLHEFVVDSKLLICQLQLQSGFKKLAENTLSSCLYECMTNGTLLQRSRFYLISVKCSLATAKICTEELINESIKILKIAKKGFVTMQDLVHKKDVVFMISQLYNAKLDLISLGLSKSKISYNKTLEKRNACALEFCQLDTASLYYVPQIF